MNKDFLSSEGCTAVYMAACHDHANTIELLVRIEHFLAMLNTENAQHRVESDGLLRQLWSVPAKPHCVTQGV